MAPNTPAHYQLSRDERLQIQALRTYGKLTYEQIAQSTGHSIRQSSISLPGDPSNTRKEKGQTFIPQI